MDSITYSHNLIDNKDSSTESVSIEIPVPVVPTLKKIPPYWHPYRTYAKQRWWNREILELVSSEFRDRSVEYYRYALESGVTTINGKVAKPGTIVRNGDRIENVVHRHEPPVTSIPVKIMHRDDEQEIIVVDKPGSIPVHATGRYYKNSLIEILVNDFGFEKVYTINRLDRLTSGCMIIALSSRRAKLLCDEFVDGSVKKEYIARCSGKFPEGETTVEQPMLTVDRQMGLNIVHPEGKYCKTTFTRMFYDEVTNTTVIHCRPWTGRSHQIRVHLQFIGYPIANDPVYNDKSVWGGHTGKGGLSFKPSHNAPADIYFPAGSHQMNPKQAAPELADPASAGQFPKKRTRLPREDGTDIGISSPVPLSDEAVSVITKLRDMKDKDEDYSRWRDVIFRAKNAEALDPSMLKRNADLSVIAQNRVNRLEAAEAEITTAAAAAAVTSEAAIFEASNPIDRPKSSQTAVSKTPSPLNLQGTGLTPIEYGLYCPECYLPLHPDPKPEKLFIFLHALRYTTREWSFGTEMPFWAVKGYRWETDEGTKGVSSATFVPGDN